MTFANVQGGTGAGRKMPGLKEKPKPWLCECGEWHPGYLRICWVSGMERPK
jgi:hypothetical protein